MGGGGCYGDLGPKIKKCLHLKLERFCIRILLKTKEEKKVFIGTVFIYTMMTKKWAKISLRSVKNVVFPYSSFWSTGQWKGGYSPPPWLRYWQSGKQDFFTKKYYTKKRPIRRSSGNNRIIR